MSKVSALSILKGTSMPVKLLFLCAAFLPFIANAQDLGTKFMADMAGTWDVQQRMWLGPKAAPIELPPGVAQRELVQGVLLREVMQLRDNGDPASAFTRSATLNFNPVAKQYEYASFDTRAPQLMVERGRPPTTQDPGELRLQGGTFLAPEWGTSRNVRFAYRLTIGPVDGNKQLVRLYFTPKTPRAGLEFLAFEYQYAKRP
jgi:hypothetical protein